MATPPDPKVKIQSLPPTLRIQNQRPISGNSKAPGVFPSSRRYLASSRGLHFHRATPGDSSPVVEPFMRARTYLARDYATLTRSELPRTFTGGFNRSARIYNKLHTWTGNINTPALVRFQPLYILFQVEQGPVFLINSRQGNVSVATLRWQVLLQTYDHFFAEFLQELSLVHLSILTLAYLCRFMVRTPLKYSSKNFLGKVLY